MQGISISDQVKICWVPIIIVDIVVEPKPACFIQIFDKQPELRTHPGTKLPRGQHLGASRLQEARAWEFMVSMVSMVSILVSWRLRGVFVVPSKSSKPHLKSLSMLHLLRLLDNLHDSTATRRTNFTAKITMWMHSTRCLVSGRWSLKCNQIATQPHNIDTHRMICICRKTQKNEWMMAETKFLICVALGVHHV